MLLRLLIHFTELDELCKDVVSSSAMSGKLIVLVPLENVSACINKISDDLQMTAVGCQVQRCPFVDTASSVQIKSHEILLRTDRLVQPDNRFDSLFLVFADCSMKCRPVFLIPHVDIHSVHD